MSQTKSKQYELVNPFILGSFNKIFTGENSLQAAHFAYQSLSQYFVGHIPKFKFTLQRVKSDYQTGGGKERDYLHFEVFEKVSKKNISKSNIEYAIRPFKEVAMFDNFQQKLQTLIERKADSILTSEEDIPAKQSGGGKYVEDEELDPELEDDFDAILNDKPIKSKKIKKKKLYAINGPLKGQTVYTSPITYYRYDPIIYTDYTSYIPVFTVNAYPQRMVYDTYIISSLK